MQRVLVIAPHPDDECLGAGGTIAQLAGQGAEVTVLTVSASLPPLSPAGISKTIEVEARRAHKLLGVTSSIFLDLPAVEFPLLPPAEINRQIQQVVDEVQPQLVFAPFPDRHLDHRAVFEAAMVTTRPIRAARCVELVALYETISETFWNVPGTEPNFAPNWTVDISDTIDAKIAAFEEYTSQLHEFPGPRSAEALRSLALFRGSQSSVGYGESFSIARSTFFPAALHQAKIQ